MWIDPSSQNVFRTHAEIRDSWKLVSFPTEIKESHIEFLGLKPIKSIPQPDYNRMNQTVVETDPILVDGEWTQQWEIRQLTQEEIKTLVPDLITMRQLRLALLQEDLLENVESTIESVSDPKQRSTLDIEWKYSMIVYRNQHWIEILANLLKISEVELDNLFVIGSTL